MTRPAETEAIGEYPLSGTGTVDAPDVAHLMSKMGGHFTENLGQVDNENIRFYAIGTPLSVGLMDDGVLFTLHESASYDNINPLASDGFVGGTSVFSLSFEGCNRVEPVGVSPLGHLSNYFTGRDLSRWATNVRSFEEVLFGDIYDGVDLRFYFRDGMFKYDFVLDAGVDPDTVVLRYEGIEGLETDPGTGDLLISTVLGTIRDIRPVVFQASNGPDGGRDGAFRLLDGDAFGFKVPGECTQDRPIVIDPGLRFSTFLGGSGYDFETTLDVDASGNIYVAGYTDSLDFPVTPSAVNTEFNGGSFDVFVAKLDPTCANLEFATYIGGSDEDKASSLRVLPGGGLCVIGYTKSEDFPIVGFALNDTPLGKEDVFVVNISTDGSILQYSTYLGGSDKDTVESLEVGSDGSVYLVGVTFSTDLPTTLGAYQRTNAGYRDAFAMRLSASLSSIMYCTYIGGSDDDYAMDIVVDAEGTSYIVGSTQSMDFPVSGGAYCTTMSGYMNGFVMVLDSYGEVLKRSTFIPGYHTVSAFSVQLGQDGFVYVAGGTNATNFPVTQDAVKKVVTGRTDCFLTVLDEALIHLEYSTLVGGSDYESAPFLAWGGGGAIIYISGGTESSDLVASVGAFDPVYRGAGDCYVAGFNTTGHTLEYLTYFGGADDDQPFEMRSDDEGNLFLAGYTHSSDFPITQGAYCSTYSSGQRLDGFVFSITPGPCVDVPGAPTGLKAESEVGDIALSWDLPPVGSCRVFKHNVFRGTVQGEEQLIASIFDSGCIYYDEDVRSGIRYYYRVSAENSVGEGPRCDAVVGRLLGPPTEALNLTLTTGNGSVALRWEPPLGPGGDQLRYRVLRGDTSNTLAPIVQDLASSSWVDDDVVLGQFYYYAVTAYCEYGDGPLSEILRIKPVSAPTPPRDFKAEPGDSSVTLSWTSPSSTGGSMLLGFRIYRGDSPETMTLLATKGPVELSLTDTGLTNGHMYIYYVTAFSEVNESIPSVAMDVIPFGRPGPVRNLAASGEPGAVVLTWSPPVSTNGQPVTRHIVSWGTDEGDLANEQEVGNVTSFRHSGLDNGVTYYYAVRPRNEAGDGPASDVVHATPMGPPGAVMGLAAISTAGGVRLTWVAPGDTGGATSLLFRVLRDTEGDPVDAVAEVRDATEWVDADTVRGTTYHYRVVAVNDAGMGPRGEPVHVTVVFVPAKVEGLAATAGNGDVALCWTAPDDGGAPILRYIIMRGLFVDALAEVGQVDGTATNFTDAAVENGKTYHYAVRAVNAMGVGPASATVNVTPMSPPGPLGLFRAKVEKGAVVLTWAAPSAGGRATVTGYVVLRGASPTELAVLARLGDVLTYTDDTVEEGKTYYYVVHATSGVGDGERVATVEAKVPKSSEDGPGFAAVLAVVGLLVVAGREAMRTRAPRRR